MPVPAQEALDRLIEGNRRYREGRLTLPQRAGAERRQELVAGQAPFAVILGCADSRVPAETIFDQGLGDLFVIRVAGNLATPTQIGSVEFAVEVLGARLVVVLGHSSCGAVAAALDQVENGTPAPTSHLEEVLAPIRHAIATPRGPDAAERLATAVSDNARVAAAELLAASPLLARHAEESGLVVRAGVYSLETGEVELL